MDFDPPSVPPPQKQSAAPRLKGRRIILCVTGSIAAYKAVALLRLLLKYGAEVDVVLTEAAEKFVTASSFSALTGKPALRGMFDETASEPHIELTASADGIVVAPATADTLARLAHGLANDLVAATALAARCPVLVAPAMHPRMWSHPATQRNITLLAKQPTVALVGPVHGEVASGDVGAGRMAEPEQIVEAIAEWLTPHDLGDRHIVVTAGPTREEIDPVRFLSNRSSGKMGFSIAERAASRGARVTLIAGPVELETPRGVDRIDVKSALEMQKEMMSALGAKLDAADALVMAAAVADFRVASRSRQKIERGSENMTLELTPNPDLLATVGIRRTSKKPVLVGFALETLEGTQLIVRARQKLIKKQVDLIVANRSEVLESSESTAFLVSATDCVDMGRLEKPVLADQILNFVAEKFQQVESNEATE